MAEPLTICEIVDGPVPPELWSPQALLSPAHGGLCSFLGVVRNEHYGRPVTGIDYECHPPLAATVFADLVAALRAEHGADLGVIMVHGTGAMGIGDAAVAIHIASGHREAAFAACRAAIEAIKRDLPVWKHEHYSDGTSAWLPGS